MDPDRMRWGANESSYTGEHPDILVWTQFFHQRYDTDSIFGTLLRTAQDIKKYRAIAVSTQWYRFSSLMPWFLTRAAFMLTDNEKRHYVMQTACEKLGKRDTKEMHSELFLEAAIQSGIPAESFELYKGYEPVTEQLDILSKALIACEDDDAVIGILLGLECLAGENMDTIFHALSFNSVAKAHLAQTQFFKLHEASKAGPVSLTVSNFIRFFAKSLQQDNFIQGFDRGITFWRGFWQAVSTLVWSGCFLSK